jgi:hypothetical protein
MSDGTIDRGGGFLCRCAFDRRRASCSASMGNSYPGIQGVAQCEGGKMSKNPRLCAGQLYAAGHRISGTETGRFVIGQSQTAIGLPRYGATMQLPVHRSPRCQAKSKRTGKMPIASGSVGCMAPMEVLRRAAVTAAIELGAIPKGCSNKKTGQHAD